jgi:glycerol-3-phosphate O-acyltransferase
MLPPKFGF